MLLNWIDGYIQYEYQSMVLTVIALALVIAYIVCESIPALLSSRLIHFLIAALYIIIKPQKRGGITSDDKKWAYMVVGAILGYYFR